jgi:hypothetical protein
VKKIRMTRDFNYRPTISRSTSFRKGKTYPKVAEMAADAIVKAGAGVVVDAEQARAKVHPAPARATMRGRK